MQPCQRFYFQRLLAHLFLAIFATRYLIRMSYYFGRHKKDKCRFCKTAINSAQIRTCTCKIKHLSKAAPFGNRKSAGICGEIICEIRVMVCVVINERLKETASLWRSDKSVNNHLFCSLQSSQRLRINRKQTVKDIITIVKDED